MNALLAEAERREIYLQHIYFFNNEMSSTKKSGVEYYSQISSREELKEAFFQFAMDNLSDQEADVMHMRLVEEEPLREIYREAVREAAAALELFEAVAHAIHDADLGNEVTAAPKDSASFFASTVNTTVKISRLQGIATIAATFVVALLLGILFSPNWNGKEIAILRPGTETDSEEPMSPGERERKSEHALLGQAETRTVLLSAGHSANVARPERVHPGQISAGILGELGELSGDIPKSPEWHKKVNDLLEDSVEIIVGQKRFSAEEIDARKAKDTFLYEVFREEVNGGIYFHDDNYNRFYKPFLKARLDYAIAMMLDYVQDRPLKENSRATARDNFFDILKRTMKYADGDNIANDPEIFVMILLACIGAAESADLREDDYRILTSYDLAISFFEIAIQIAPDNDELLEYLNRRLKKFTEEFEKILVKKMDYLSKISDP